ncbi:MAG: hypothetical protein NVS3B26_17670 [Mycobacteriales bacterium]
MLVVRHRPLMAACAAAAALSLSACANVNGPTIAAPKPVQTLPSQVSALVKTDVGEYLVQPRAGVSAKDVQNTIAKLKVMPGVGTVTLTKQGKIDMTFRGNPPEAQRAAIVRQMAALGPIEEGI